MMTPKLGSNTKKSSTANPTTDSSQRRNTTINQQQTNTQGQEQNTQQQQQQQPQPRRTNRLSKSCYSCRKRKVKCNFEIPCDRCIARNRAHLCSKEPIIVDGLILNAPGNETELKFSQENEVLKKKIKELEETIKKMKLENSDIEDGGTTSGTSPSTRKRKSVSATSNTPQVATNVDKKGDKPFVVENSSIVFKPKSTKEIEEDKLVESRRWDSYSITLGLINRGLADESYYDGEKKLCFNTEDWITLGSENKRKLIPNVLPNDDESTVWNYFLQIIGKFDKQRSDIVIYKILKWGYQFNVLNPQAFIQEYEEYWSNSSIKEKHVTALRSKTASQYMFLSEYYMLLCYGMFTLDDSFQKELDFTDLEWNIYPRATFACGLECLHRGRYLTVFNMKTHEIFTLIKICSHHLGGNMLANCLYCSAALIAREMHLDRIDPNLPNIEDPDIQAKIGAWWGLVFHDWFEAFGRLSTIPPGSFITPPPSKWIVKDKKINWYNFCFYTYTKIGTIKRKYYIPDENLKNRISLKGLKKADVALRLVKFEMDKDFENYVECGQYNSDPEFKRMIDFTKYILNHHLANELLDVNRQMSIFMNHSEWTATCHETCVNCARALIRGYTSPNHPDSFRNVWLSPLLTISGAIFLLVDCMLNSQAVRYQKDTIDLVRSILPYLGSYRQPNRPAVRGAYVIQKLINLMLGTDKIATFSQLREMTKVTQVFVPATPMISGTGNVIGSRRNK
ncbi:unnamed protein product [Ambrosiozyma monospora]|uniref:Unnamed protein product n=1 Tax=Ambrosiozyma monospora TaxID=43982 RepID=A0ACB5SVV1_AMBMO|nr:unnamed protein product [Ambrosiozyma monospora]